MPTAKPRVQVTLEPETHAVIERFAQLQGRTRGSVIAELLDEIAPSIGRTIALLEAAMDAPDQVKAGLRSVAEGLHQELVDVSGEANRQFHLLMEKIEAGDSADEQADPHLVTRGSGTQPPAPAKPSKRPSNRSKSRY